MLGTFLIPATIARLASAATSKERVSGEGKGDAASSKKHTQTLSTEISDVESEWGKAAMASMKRRKMTTGRRVGGLFRGTNLWYTIGWIVMIALSVYITKTPLQEKRFDPYDILDLRVGASTKEIKSAYRKLSLKYHPDKNPDPAAAVYFAESIAPAYKTLTDDVARENYEKYGHPDGKQSTKLGIALPEQLFGKGGMAPVMLIVLVVGGIMLPLFIAMCSIRRMNKFGGNNVLKQTQVNYARMLKPVLALSKVPETLAVAHEFIETPFLDGQDAAVSQLLKDYKNEYESKDQKLMKRLPTIIKAHMLILTQTSRRAASLPSVLSADAKKVVLTLPRLIEELLKIAAMPINRAGHSYARPQISVMEFYQCFTQGVPLSSRKRDEDGNASLLQLPHFSTENLNGVAKTCKSLRALMKLSSEDRKKLLIDARFSEAATKDIERQLAVIPRVTTFEAKISVDDDDDSIMEGDFVTAKLKIKIGRSGGPLGGALPPLPFCAADRTEGWRVFVYDQSTNTLLASSTLKQRDIEKAERGDEPLDLSVQFVGLPSGMYNVGVSLMSDYWIGVDAKVLCMMKVLKPTATNVAAREAKSASRSDVTKPNAEVEEEELSESDYSDDDDEDDYSDEDYPSDETGTSESDDEARARIDAMRGPEKTTNTVKEDATAAKPASAPQRKTSTFGQKAAAARPLIPGQADVKQTPATAEPVVAEEVKPDTVDNVD